MKKNLVLILVMGLLSFKGYTPAGAFLPDIRNISSDTKNRMSNYAEFWLDKAIGEFDKKYNVKSNFTFRCWEGQCEEYYKLYNRSKDGTLDNEGLSRAKELLEVRWYELDIVLNLKKGTDEAKEYHFYFDYEGLIHSVWTVNPTSKSEQLVEKFY